MRSTEINAFLGLRQLNTLDDRIAARNANMHHFLQGLPEGLWKDYRTEGMSSFALPLIAQDEEAYRSVDSVLERLEIERRPVVAGNLLRQPFIHGHNVRAAPQGISWADHIHRLGSYVGNGHHVTTAELDQLLLALEDTVQSRGVE